MTVASMRAPFRCRVWIGSLLIAVFATASCARGRAAEDVCATPAEAREEFLERPFAEVDRPGKDAPAERIRLNKRCSFTESELLDYFVSAPDRLPTITSEVKYRNHDTYSNTQLFRTWEFPGLTIHGQVGAGGTVCADSISLHTAVYPLICGLKVGSPLEEFKLRLGDPITGGMIRYGYGDIPYTIQITTDEQGKVKDIEWSFPPQC